MNIGEHIKRERSARNWSLNDLAQRAGVSKGYLSTLERGEVDPSLSHLQFIAKAFDMGAGDLLVWAGYTFNQKMTTHTVILTIRGDVLSIEKGG